MSRAAERLAVPLDAADAVDVERVGGKAATLARLLQAGLPVPDGICLTADAYRLQLEASGVSRIAEKFATADNEYEGRGPRRSCAHD